MTISAVRLPDREQPDQPFEKLAYVTAVPSATNLPALARDLFRNSIQLHARLELTDSLNSRESTPLSLVPGN